MPRGGRPAAGKKPVGVCSYHLERVKGPAAERQPWGQRKLDLGYIEELPRRCGVGTWAPTTLSFKLTLIRSHGHFTNKHMEAGSGWEKDAPGSRHVRAKHPCPVLMGPSQIPAFSEPGDRPGQPFPTRAYFSQRPSVTRGYCTGACTELPGGRIYLPPPACTPHLLQSKVRRSI